MINYYQAQVGNGVPAFDETPIARQRAGKDYIAEPALQRAVNLAIFLGQPLLLTGEPGTGKTELARHLAQRLSPDGGLEDFYAFNTKTTSTAQDLFAMIPCGTFSLRRTRRNRSAMRRWKTASYSIRHWAKPSKAAGAALC